MAMENGKGALTMELNKPQRLRKGDVVGVICPASAPISEGRIEAGVRYLEGMGYRVRLGRWVGEQHGYFAGTDEQRAEDFNAMLRDPAVRAIIAVRGGYGCARLLPLIDYAWARRHPKILVGYSDLTSLQMALWRRAGWVSFSGPMVGAEFADGVDPFTEAHFWRTITSPHRLGRFPQPEGDRVEMRIPGKAEGRLLGGCLALVLSLIGTPYQPNFRESLLVLEDVHEAPHRIDRMLTQLGQARVLERLSGLILGKFTDCGTSDRNKPHLSFQEMLDEVLGDNCKRGIPCMENFAYGHVPVRVTVPWGLRAKMDARRGVLDVLEGAVL